MPHSSEWCIHTFWLLHVAKCLRMGAHYLKVSVEVELQNAPSKSKRFPPSLRFYVGIVQNSKIPTRQRPICRAPRRGDADNAVVDTVRKATASLQKHPNNPPNQSSRRRNGLSISIPSSSSCRQSPPRLPKNGYVSTRSGINTCTVLHFWPIALLPPTPCRLFSWRYA